MAKLSQKNKAIKVKIQLYDRWFDISHLFPKNVWQREDLSTYLPKMLKRIEFYIETNYQGYINLNVYNAIRNGSTKELLTLFKDKV